MGADDGNCSRSPCGLHEITSSLKGGGHHTDASGLVNQASAIRAGITLFRMVTAQLSGIQMTSIAPRQGGRAPERSGRDAAGVGAIRTPVTWSSIALAAR